jgi:hypothetical protein
MKCRAFRQAIAASREWRGELHYFPPSARRCKRTGSRLQTLLRN